jgi:predicted hydrocarbon binding protein
MMQAGTAFFNSGIGPFMENYGAGLDFGNKLVPLSLKLPLFLKWIARTYNATSDLIVEVRDGGDHYLYVNKRCPICWGREVQKPDCHHTLGFLQAATNFIAIDSRFQIRQVTSIGAGDPSCDFVVPKHPIPN